MKEKELTLKEAEQIVDTMYQNKFINSGTIEDNNIHLGNMDNIEFTDLENASIYLLREEIRLKQELQRKDNIINELKTYLNKEVESFKLDGYDESDVRQNNLWLAGCYDEDLLILKKINELEGKDE